MVFPSRDERQAGAADPVVATAGEALMDLITEADARLRPCEGGAVYNLTRALGLQGVGTRYLNPLSVDGFGARLRQGLLDARVTLAHPVPVPQPTSLAVVGLDAAGKPAYSFHREGVADRQVSADGLIAHCAEQRGLQLVATGCLALLPEDAAHTLPWLREQRRAGRLVVVDANLRPAVAADLPAYRRSVRDALAQAHLVKASDDDLELLGVAGHDPLARARRLMDETGAAWMALTLGAQGAWLLARDGRAWHGQEPAPVPVVDTVGAGDCFLAGLIAALLHEGVGDDPALLTRAALDDPAAGQVLGSAIASASLCVMRTGCQPPDRDAVRRRLAHTPPTVRRPGGPQSETRM